MRQAQEPNPDGTYTIVISPTDPASANWVSTGGLNQGTISIRFQDLDPNSSDLPTVSSQVVSLDKLAGVLPPTPSTPGQLFLDSARGGGWTWRPHPR